MATIAVDIDSTLYDFEGPSREAMYKKYKETDDPVYMHGAYMPWTEWRSPTDALGLEKWLGVIAMVHDSEVIRRMEPYPGAVDTCQALMRQGHRLLYISNRATEAADATEEWLNAHGFTGVYETDSCDVLCLMGDKAPHMAKCQYLIDDRPKTVVQFVYDYEWRYSLEDVFYSQGEFNESYEDFLKRNQRKAFVKGYPYNQALTDVPNTYVAMDWYGINEYLVRKNVLKEAAIQPLEV